MKGISYCNHIEVDILLTEMFVVAVWRIFGTSTRLLPEGRK